MAVSILIEDRIRIPAIESLADFRRWALSAEFPESGRIDFINGQIEVDMSPEDLYTHGTLKAEIASVIHQRSKRIGGQTFIDGTRITLPSVGISTEPDVLLVMNDSLNSGKVTRTAKAGGGQGRYVEFEGAADLIVEIVSDSSESKDMRRLPTSYFQAGVLEYWLVDARCEPLVFQIHRRGLQGFEPAEVDANGYQISTVLKKAYSLRATPAAANSITYDLLEKAFD